MFFSYIKFNLIYASAEQVIPAQRSLGTKYFTTEPVSVDCSTNSPCQHRSKYIPNNMENVYIDVRLEKS